MVLALLQGAPEGPAPALERVEDLAEALRGADAALVTGEPDRARAGFERALELSARNPTVAYGMACAAAAGGDRDALRWLRIAVDWGWRDAAMARWDPELEAVRADERFAAQLERMEGLPAQAEAPGADDHPWRLLVAADGPALPAVATLSADALLVAAGHEDGRVELLDAATGTLRRELAPLEAPTWALEFSPDGSRLAGVGHDGRWRLWDLEAGSAGELRRAVEASRISYPFGIRIAWAPDGARLVIVDERGDASLWSVAGDELARWTLEGSECDRRVLWLPSGQRLLTTAGEVVELRDGRTGAALARPITCPRPIVALALAPDARTVASGHADGWGLLWDLASGAELARRQFVDPWLPEPSDEIAAIAFAPMGGQLAWSTREGSFVEVRDAASLELSWQSEFLGAHFGEALPLRWSPDGSHLWYAFECGRGGIETVSPRLGAVSRLLAPAAVPAFAGTRGTLVASGGVTVVDSASGRMLWRRIEVPGGTLIQASTGHFNGSWTSLDRIGTVSDWGQEPIPLDPRRVELLFDPRRVRAARAGVPLAPPRP
jgi:hypothetical protein